jgi:signal transduction histidine kinase
MINGLVEVTRREAGKVEIEPQCTSVSDAIDYVVNTLQGAATAKGVALTSEIELRLPSVCADPRAFDNRNLDATTSYSS